jgi:hypothetical protein
MTSGLKAQLAAHLQRHRDEGILLDTNVLLLLWLAKFDPRLIGGKRLEKYTPEDAVLLAGYVGQFKRILTTSTILTETSNLAAQVLSGQPKQALFRRFFPSFGASPPDDFHRCSVDGLTLDESIFVRLGFTDASIAATVGTQHLLLTDDLDLYLAAQAQGAPAINFTHMREAAGLL